MYCFMILYLINILLCIRYTQVRSMETLSYAIHAFLFLSSWIGTGGEASIALTRVPVETEENSSVTLSCYSTPDQITARMYWLLLGTFYRVNLTDNACGALDYPLNRTDMYTLTCSGSNNISLTIKKVDRLQHGDTWRCRVGRYTSHAVTIYVTVPVETLEIMDTNRGYIAENQTSRFGCKSSFSRPKPNIYWFLNNGTSDFHDDERIISNITESIVQKTIRNKTDNILTSTESELALKVQRSMDSQHIYCLTNDTLGTVFRSTMEILNISYPPDGPPYVRGSGKNGTYDVIDKYKGNLSCIVTGGNPLPNLNWSCLKTGSQTLRRSSKTVTSYFTWTASMDNNKMNCTCQSLYIGGQSSAIVSINVLYKAAINYFGAADFENNKNITTVNQGEKTLIICKVESNPFSNSTIFFKGRLVNETIRSNTVTYNLINSKCSDAGRYICEGKNEYNYEADASKELFLYVKCLPQPSASQPPEKNVSVALSDSALFRFHAAPYYDPGITEFRWFKQENDSRILFRNETKTYILSSDIHSVLHIIDVSDADYGMYILEYNNSAGMNNFTFYLHQSDQTVSEDILQGNNKNYIPKAIGIVIAVLVIVGITLGMVIYIRRYKQNTDSSNSDRSYDNICVMHTTSGGNNMNREPVYEGLKPIDERGYVEMKEQTYDILKPKRFC